MTTQENVKSARESARWMREGVCPLCRKIEALSGNVLYDTFFSQSVLEGEQEGLPLPGGYRMVTDDEKSLKKRMEEDIFM